MIKERVQTVFRDVFDDPSIEIFDDMTAKDIEDWDSLAHIQLISAIQDEFGVKFSLQEVVSIKNVGEFIHLISEKKA